MKKILILILAVTLFVPAALAEDLSSLSDEELLNLQKQVEEELIRRNLYPLADDVPVDSENIALFERLDSFWAASDYLNMLDYCVSDWKNQMEAPRQSCYGFSVTGRPSILKTWFCPAPRRILNGQRALS